MICPNYETPHFEIQTNEMQFPDLLRICFSAGYVLKCITSSTSYYGEYLRRMFSSFSAFSL